MVAAKQAYVHTRGVQDSAARDQVADVAVVISRNLRSPATASPVTCPQDPFTATRLALSH